MNILRRTLRWSALGSLVGTTLIACGGADEGAEAEIAQEDEAVTGPTGTEVVLRWIPGEQSHDGDPGPRSSFRRFTQPSTVFFPWRFHVDSSTQFEALWMLALDKDGVGRFRCRYEVAPQSGLATLKIDSCDGQGAFARVASLDVVGIKGAYGVQLAAPLPPSVPVTTKALVVRGTLPKAATPAANFCGIGKHAHERICAETSPGTFGKPEPGLDPLLVKGLDAPLHCVVDQSTGAAAGCAGGLLLGTAACLGVHLVDAETLSPTCFTPATVGAECAAGAFAGASLVSMTCTDPSSSVHRAFYTRRSQAPNSGGAGPWSAADYRRAGASTSVAQHLAAISASGRGCSPARYQELRAQIKDANCDAPAPPNTQRFDEKFCSTYGTPATLRGTPLQVRCALAHAQASAWANCASGRRSLDSECFDNQSDANHDRRTALEDSWANDCIHWSTRWCAGQANVYSR